MKRSVSSVTSRLCWMAEEGASLVWAGEVPCVISLAAEEVTTLEAPLPFHLVLPRQSFLPFLTAPAHEYFKPFAPPIGGGEPWYECKGVALRWELPVGLLFDVHAGEQRFADLPWHLTLHFQSLPRALLSSSTAGAEAALLNTIKESCYLRCGTSLPAMSLSLAKQKELTASLMTNDHSAYCAVASKISAGISAHLGEGGVVHAVPIRVFISPHEWRQQPVAPSLSSGEPTRLCDLLETMLPSFFGSAASETARVIVQGVRVPLDIPVLWLYSMCNHPDGFLYVICQLSAPPLVS
ncbi:MAG: hypothetical protein SGPRY_006689 [Prymnesium sp.]